MTVTKVNPAGDSFLYSTYLGGTGYDYGYSVAVDTSGNTYVAGYTDGAFPITPGAFMPGGLGAFLAKLDVSGASLSYANYLSYSDSAVYGVAVDAQGRAVATGSTSSAVFPTTPGAVQPAFGGNNDVFVLRLNSSGSGLDYSTYLGRSGGDAGYRIAVDSSGNAYVTGWTWSIDFPATAGTIGTINHGRADAFIVRLNAEGTLLTYAAYLGGSGTEVGNAVAIDSQGNAYVAGWTESIDFPVTDGAFQPGHGGGPPSLPHAPNGQDNFVTKVNSDGTGLLYSTYLGGSGTEYAYGIAVDPDNAAYVTGYTTSAKFPTTAGSLQTALRGSADAFLTKVNATGELAYSTYLGGTSSDSAYGVATDSVGNAYVAGNTGSADFLTTAGALQRGLGGGAGSDAFLTKINGAGSDVLHSTYLRGSNSETGRGIAVDSSGNMYLTAPSGCSWTAASDSDWVTIRGSSSGSGSYAVR